jgi:hypothetical protein
MGGIRSVGVTNLLSSALVLPATELAWLPLRWCGGAVPVVVPATAKEVMTHHALSKQKKHHRQGDDEQELYISGPR